MKTIVTAGICLLTLSVSAQKINFKLGSEYELPKRAQDLSFFGNGKAGLVNLALKDKRLYAVRFDPTTLEKTEEQAIDIENASKNYNYESIAQSGEKVYFMHSDWDKGSETETLYYDEIDLKKGKINTQNVKMLETTKLAGDAESRGFYSMKTVDKYTFNYNHDSSFLLVSYRLHPEVRNDKKNFDKIGLQVFDRNMKKLWGKEFTMPYTEAIMDNSDFTVDGSGNAYLLARVFDSEARKSRNKETGEPAYRYELMKFTANAKKPVITTVTNNEHFVITANIITGNDELMIAATFSKKGHFGQTAGIYLASIDDDGKIQKFRNGYYSFPKEELEKFESARKRRSIERKENYEAPDLVVKNIVVGKDGSVLIACEEYFLEITTVTNANGTTRIVYKYHYNDIIAARINNSGDFDWVRKIPKEQRGYRYVGTMSFKLIADASGYYFLYLDNIHNLDLKEGEEPKMHLDGFGGQVMLTTISPAGEMKKSIAFDTRSEDIMIYPSWFSAIDTNVFIGRAELKRGLYQPVLITLK